MTGLISMRANRQTGEPLPPLLLARLARYVPDLDLDAVRLHQGIPRYVPGQPRGYVNRHRIYLATGCQDAADTEFLALLAHELVHVRQYQELGPWRFRWAYVCEYVAGRWRGMGHDAAYRNISFERAAREVEMVVRHDFARGTVNA